MKIALVVGPFPRGQCGVGDYVDLLAESLNSRGVETHVIDSDNWGLLNSSNVHRSLKRQGFDLVQLHYPSLGFGSKLGVQALSLFRRCVITLHEGSQSRPLRRLALLPFSVRPRHVIFFSKFERDFGLKWAPWISNISSIIPPPSNIRRFPYAGPRNLGEVIFFGLIRPGNGYDSLLEFASLLTSGGPPLRLRLIGSLQSAKFTSYFEELQRRSRDLPIIWDHSLTEEQVAERLAKSAIAYLPYPGGAAELRSTLKAALLNGLAIITTRGDKTPSDLDGVVKFAENPRRAVEITRELLSSAAEREALSHKAENYVREWTWERTAELHERIYRSLLIADGSESLLPAVSSAHPGAE
jgi:glycosyltransferase involved in cell wall biosynthesis